MGNKGPADITQQAIAANVRREADERRMKQVEIGRIIGQGRANTSRRMNGLAPFRHEELRALAEAFGVSLDQLYDTTVTTGAGAA